MSKLKNCMLAASLICGTQAVLTSCASKVDNSATDNVEDSNAVDYCFYLSQYFSSLGMNYNAYINGLRIDHFVNLYLQAVADKQSFTVRKLAQDSGYRNYTTFSNAFKQRMGQSVTAWMSEAQ